MNRRLARERREYIYRKSLEGKEKEQYEKKRKIWQALQEGKPVPTELREDELNIRKELELEGSITARTVNLAILISTREAPASHVDDEYARAGLADPKIFITTSRDPSSRLVQFSKEVRLIFPNSQRVNRGNHVIKDLVEACRANEVTDIVILHEHRGEPDGLIVSHLPYGPTAYFGIQNCVLRHDIKDGLGTMSEAFPHIIFENFTTPLGQRVKNILRYLFPVPKDDSKRMVTFANQSDFISFRHHLYEKQGKDIQLKEVGPRFELRLYQIKLGTVDISEAENEWVLRPYLTTAKRRDAL